MKIFALNRTISIIIWSQCVFFTIGILVFSIGIQVYQVEGISGYSLLYLLMLSPGLIFSRKIGQVVDGVNIFKTVRNSIILLLIISFFIINFDSLFFYYFVSALVSILVQVVSITTSSSISIATPPDKMNKAQGLQTSTSGIIYIITPIISNTFLNYQSFYILGIICCLSYLILLLTLCLIGPYFTHTHKNNGHNKDSVTFVEKGFFLILPLQSSYVFILSCFNSYALSSLNLSVSNITFFMIGLGGFLGGLLCFKLKISTDNQKALSFSCLLILLSYLTLFSPYLVLLGPVMLGISYNLAFSLTRAQIKAKYRDSIIGSALGRFQFYAGIGSLLSYTLVTVYPSSVSSPNLSIALAVFILLITFLYLSKDRDFSSDKKIVKRKVV